MKFYDRDEAITEIKAALKRRSNKPWSVTGGRGTAWGWITVISPPKRREPRRSTMTDEDCAELANLFGFERPVHSQGISISACNDDYQEHIDRANGREPSVIAQPYWD